MLLLLFISLMWLRGACEKRIFCGVILCLFMVAPSFARDNKREPVLTHDDEAEQVFPSGKAMQEDDLSSDDSLADSVRGAPPSFPVQEETDESEDRRTQFPEQEPQFPSAAVEPLYPTAPPVPTKIPPFMSRPSEWETTPPTVIGVPPLPAATVFSGRELAAFQFVEVGKESFDQEHWEQAEEQFERAISVAPFLPYSYYFLGRIAFARGDHKRALAFLQKAELLFPHTERAWLGETDSVKGFVYEELDDYKQARIAYRKSLRFQPANLKVLSALARLPEEEPLPSDAIVQ
jgi:tetratricopeptide (TPR) repeat protein